MTGAQHPRRRAADQLIDSRFDEGDARMDKIEALIEGLAKEQKAQGAVQAAQGEVLEDIRDLVMMGRSLFRFAGWLGSFLKWVMGVGAAGFGILTWWKTGHPPTPKL